MKGPSTESNILLTKSTPAVSVVGDAVLSYVEAQRISLIKVEAGCPACCLDNHLCFFVFQMGDCVPKRQLHII